MQNCTLFDEDPAESARCLFAMPSLALSTGNATMVASAVTQTIQFVLNSGGERRECRGSLPGGQVACLFGVQVWLLAIRVGQVFVVCPASRPVCLPRSVCFQAPTRCCCCFSFPLQQRWTGR